MLLPDGSVVMNFDGAGMVKIDRCSRLIWRVPLETHHAVDVAPDGEIFAPARRKLRQVGPELPGVRTAEDGFVWNDSVVRLAADGSILAETPLLERLLASGHAAELYANALAIPELPDYDDPLHLNDVEVLRADMAAAFPQFAAGDLLVSMRNINAIAVLDGKTLLVKWWRTGPFLRQHDPDFLPNGHILVFDNRLGGRDRRFGESRIVEIDPKNPVPELVWSFTGSERQPFYSNERGKQQSPAQRQHPGHRSPGRPRVRARPRRRRRHCLGMGERTGRRPGRLRHPGRPDPARPVGLCRSVLRLKPTGGAHGPTPGQQIS